MAGPFARQGRGEGAPPEPDAHTEVLETADPAPAGSPADPTDGSPPADAPSAADASEAAIPADTLPDEATPGFVERGRLRRRLRYVRRAREVALRDLGGLIFDLHRFGRDRTDLVDQKLAALTSLDGEQRALETALDERRETTVLREPGLASCPRCGALHASDAGYCSACGLPVGRGADLPTGPSLTGPLGALPSANGTAAPADEPTAPTAAEATGRPAPGTGADAAGSPERDRPASSAVSDDRPAPDEQPTTRP